MRHMVCNFLALVANSARNVSDAMLVGVVAGDVEEGLHARVLARPEVDELRRHARQADQARTRSQVLRQGQCARTQDRITHRFPWPCWILCTDTLRMHHSPCVKENDPF